MIAGILRPESGAIHTEGRVAALLELGAGFFYEYSGRENIYLSAAILGRPRAYIDEVIDEIIEFAGLERFIDNAVKTYSSGMFARLGFSIAVHLDPDILLIDEILAVGDEAFSRKSYDRIADLRSKVRTMVVVSRALDSIQEVCTDCLWLESGDIKAHGSAASVIDEYVSGVNRTEAAERQQHAQALQQPKAHVVNAVTVASVTIYGSGRPAAVLETGDPMQIHIAYESDAPLEGVQLGLEVVREDGVLVLGCSPSEDEISGVVIPPTGVIVVNLPSLPLLHGLYRVGVRFQDLATREDYVYLPQAFPFRVVSPHRLVAGLTLLGQE